LDHSRASLRSRSHRSKSARCLRLGGVN